VKFTSFAVELEALTNKNLAGLQILVDKDFPLEARRIMENLIPNLKGANKFGLRAFLEKRKEFTVEGHLYDLEYVMKNV
jgi:hypothetical protein